MRSEVKNSYAHVTMQGILNKIIEMDFFVKVRKPKADWHAIDSPKMRTKEIGFFAMTVRKYFKLEISISSLKYFQTVKQKKTNWFVWFLGESTMCLSAYGFIWPLGCMIWLWCLTMATSKLQPLIQIVV